MRVSSIQRVYATAQTGPCLCWTDRISPPDALQFDVLCIVDVASFILLVLPLLSWFPLCLSLMLFESHIILAHAALLAGTPIDIRGMRPRTPFVNM